MWDTAEITIILLLVLQLWQTYSTKRKVKKMASELTAAVAAIANDVTELQGAVQRVLGLLTQPNPDVAAAVSALQNADAAFDALRDSLNAVGASDSTPPTA